MVRHGHASGQLHFDRTAVEGVYVVETLQHSDQRGSFRRLWCRQEADAAHVRGEIVQTSLSVTARRGTLRGMHFQLPPSREDKVVTCVRGRIFDVALDLRPRSASYLRHVGVELAENEPRALYIPAGCAHGFLTLTDDCAVLYMMTDYYSPSLSCGVRWDDPAFGIAWPEEPKEILERDARYPDFDPRTVDGFAEY